MLGHAPLFLSGGQRLPDDLALLAPRVTRTRWSAAIRFMARLGADGFYHLPEGK